MSLIEKEYALEKAENQYYLNVINEQTKNEIIRFIKNLPSAQPDIKQAAKLLSDFIESCPGGDSYLITPDGEDLRTDWGYAVEGIQLIHDWAERRTDGRD